MKIIDYIHIALLAWGSIFSLITALCMFMSRNFNKNKRKWILLLQIATAFLLAADAFAWGFKTMPGQVGYVVIRLSNYAVFVCTDIITFIFNAYICSYLFNEKQVKSLWRVKAAGILSIIGIIMVCISQFNNMYYYFDDMNMYHRSKLYWISMAIPVCSMFIDFSLVVQYRKNVSHKMFVAMLSYFVLPVVAAIVQMNYYGYSFISISICISTILIFIVATVEQNKELYYLERSRSRAVEKLEVATTLNKCVAQLSSEKDMDLAIDNLLEVINDYFMSDRTYIFEIRPDDKYMDNTYEYVRPGITAQKENLQNISVETVSKWMESFRKYKVYYMADIEQERGSDSYDIIDDQDIQNLLAVPLLKEDRITGFLGVDNPRSHYDDATLLSSIQYFVTNGLENKRHQELLQILSYRDLLSGINNRNRYIKVIEEYDGKTLYRIGVAYIDLNGLKQVNDSIGHEAGDELICKTAGLIRNIFADQCYRVGGDEFVVVCMDIQEDEFRQKIDNLRESMKANQVDVSIGDIWMDKTYRLEEMLTKADKLMYLEKNKHYNNN